MFGNIRMSEIVISNTIEETHPDDQANIFLKILNMVSVPIQKQEMDIWHDGSNIFKETLNDFRIFESFKLDNDATKK